MNALDKLHIVKWFLLTRYFLVFKQRKALVKYQKKQLRKHVIRLHHSIPFYKRLSADFSCYPTVSKPIVNDAFEDFNKREISRTAALKLALQAENDRNFSPTLDGVTVGLSSGTSGNRGVFLVTPKERRKWAGIILAKLLTRKAVNHILSFWKPPIRIAFFLRSNSNLYTSVNSSRIEFNYIDLLEGIEKNVAQLKKTKPHILIAPASILLSLARDFGGEINKQELKQVVSVAEVLSKSHKKVIEEKLGLPVQEVYQCSEGLLATTCKMGHLHLNEQFVYFEKEWIDNDRFYPILTDFGRHFQAMVRYRLDDVLRIDKTPCACGLACTRIASIEGRQDEILWFRKKDSSGTVPVFPDNLRQLMFSLPMEVLDFRIFYSGKAIKVYLKQDDHQLREAIKSRLTTFLEGQGLAVPQLSFHDWYEQPAGEKMKRIIFKEYA